MKHRHHHKSFSQYWFVWIFGGLFLTAFLGKTGLMPFFAPFLLVLFFGPWWWKMGHGPRRHPRRFHQPRPPRPAPPVTQVHVIYPNESVSKSTRRDTSDLPMTCASCGGPVNNTTIRWKKDDHPACGFCGTGLR
jgi:hypothetical protein